MRPNGGKLNKKQESLIACLLTQPNCEQAAAAAGVAASTLYRWMKAPEFKEAYREARKGLLEQTIGRLVGLQGKALDRLEKNLDSDSDSASNRAAELILTHANKGIETLDLFERIEELERVAAEQRR